MLSPPWLRLLHSRDTLQLYSNRRRQCIHLNRCAAWLISLEVFRVDLIEDRKIIFHIRQEYGVTIIGIVRGDEVIASPDVNTVLLAGDTLMTFGKSEQVANLASLCNGEGV